MPDRESPFIGLGMDGASCVPFGHRAIVSAMRPEVEQVGEALTTAFGPGLAVRDDDAREVLRVWPSINRIEAALAAPVSEARLRALWTRRQPARGVPLLLLVPAGGASVRVLGPGRAEDPVCEVSLEGLIRVLHDLAGKTRRAAAAELAAALERMDRGEIPGVVVRGLLTKHLLTKRLCRDHPGDGRRWRLWQVRLVGRMARMPLTIEFDDWLPIHHDHGRQPFPRFRVRVRDRVAPHFLVALLLSGTLEGDPQDSPVRGRVGRTRSPHSERRCSPRPISPSRGPAAIAIRISRTQVRSLG